MGQPPSVPPWDEHDYVWIEGLSGIRPTLRREGGFAFLITRAPVSADGWHRFWWVYGWEMGISGDALRYRTLCIPEDTPLAVRDSATGLQAPRRMTDRERARSGSHWRRVDDLKGTYTGLPYNAPRRLRVPWLEP